MLTLTRLFRKLKHGFEVVAGLMSLIPFVGIILLVLLAMLAGWLFDLEIRKEI